MSKSVDELFGVRQCVLGDQELPVLGLRLRVLHGRCTLMGHVESERRQDVASLNLPPRKLPLRIICGDGQLLTAPLAFPERIGPTRPHVLADAVGRRPHQVWRRELVIALLPYRSGGEVRWFEMREQTLVCEDSRR